MNDENLKITNVWNLYEYGKNYNRMQTLYEDSIDNWNMYHGKQWEGLKKPKSQSDPVVFNIIKPIVKYKVGVVIQNSYSIEFNPNTYDTPEELTQLKAICKGLSQHINRVWEKDQMGKKTRISVKDACVNTEGIVYVYDAEYMDIIDKDDIFYGNESEEDLQKQPYIIIRKRLPVLDVKHAVIKNREEGKSDATDAEIESIVKDSDIFERENPNRSLEELTDMCTVLMMFKRNEEGIVLCSESTKTCEILKPQETGCTLYPVAHYIWESEKNYARGSSEVKVLRYNQLEINKTATRRSLAVKMGAYPKLVYDKKTVSNPEALNQIGSAIALKNMRADDINKVVSYLKPASMSSDSSQLQNDLITNTRELAGAGETATGNVDPTQASGKAIVAVQNASQQPISEQIDNYRYFLEDVANILYEQIKVYNDGLTIYQSEDIVDETGAVETIDRPFKVNKKELDKYNLNTKIDVTPTSPYDVYSVLMTLENLFMNGQLSFEEFVESIPDNATGAKPRLQEVLRKRKERQKQIAQMERDVENYNQAVNEVLMEEGVVSDGMYGMPQANVGGESSRPQVVSQM